MKNKLIKLIGAAAVASGMVSSVQAVPTLYVNGSVVGSSPSGDVFFSGTVSGWRIIVESAVGSPPDSSLGGGVSHPVMDLDFQVIQTATASGALTLAFSDDFLGPINALAIHGIGGTTAGQTVNSSILVSPSSPAGASVTGTADLALKLGPLSGASFAQDKSGLLIAGPNSTITIQDTISLGAAGSTVLSGNENLTVPTPDGGTTLALLGMAFSGCAVLRRKFARA